MADAEQLTVDLTPDAAGVALAAVESGEYASVGEVVSEALQNWSRQRSIGLGDVEQLRRLAREGIDSGPGLDASAVFARLRARYGGQATV